MYWFNFFYGECWEVVVQDKVGEIVVYSSVYYQFILFGIQGQGCQ